MCVMSCVWCKTDGDLVAERERETEEEAVCGVTRPPLRLFSVFTVGRSKHRRCLFPLHLQQTQRSLQAAVTVFVVQTSNYYTAPTFIQLLSNTHTHARTHTHTHTHSLLSSLFM